jgi:hypothetical protein
VAISDSYETAANYRAATGKTDTGQDAEILKDLEAISRYLEGKLNRFFNKDAAAVARIYIPNKNTKIITVDDMSEAPSLVRVDTDDDGQYATTLAATDYEIIPLNADKSPEPRPWYQIRLLNWGDVSYFYEGERIEVTTKYGWPAVPEAVKRATIHLTAILRLESPRATSRIAELGEVIEASPIAQGIIRQLTDQYKVWLV